MNTITANELAAIGDKERESIAAESDPSIRAARELLLKKEADLDRLAANKPVRTTPANPRRLDPDEHDVAEWWWHEELFAVQFGCEAARRGLHRALWNCEDARERANRVCADLFDVERRAAELQYR